MKRAILLTLILAISISLASASFALYSKTLPVAQTSFSAKIFDVSLATPTIIVESKYLKDSPSWVFMAFNSTKKNQPFDMITEVTLSTTESTANLTVGLYNTDGTVVISPPVNFDAVTNKAEIIVYDEFPTDEAVEHVYVLKFFYNGNNGTQAISPTNPTSLYNAATFSVKVWAKHNYKPH